MAFWQENYSFIKDVYETRITKMIEWMDHLEMAISKVMATKVYTSNEFKRERENFISLCKNLERADTRKWLSEVLEVLFRDRGAEEKKVRQGFSDFISVEDESKRLESVIERHVALIPKVKETQVKSEVFWKCYEYGDDLVQIFEFIDDQRAKSVREIQIPDPESAEEFIDKHASIVRLMENKRKTVEEFIKKGESLMDDDRSPKFLEAHVNKLKEAWTVANDQKEKRKNALNDNLEAWKYFEEKRLDCARVLDNADAELKTLKKNFNMERAPQEHREKLQNAARLRSEIEELFAETEGAFKTLAEFAPEDKKKELEVHVIDLSKRLSVLEEIDKTLVDLNIFNQELVMFDSVLTELDTWICGPGQERLDSLRQSDKSNQVPDPEEKVTRAMELMEDLLKRITTCTKAEEKKKEIFPPEGKKLSRDAKEFVERLKSCREGVTRLQTEIQAELDQFSVDVKHYADYQTGLRSFYPWLLSAEEKVSDGVCPPAELVPACNLLGDCKTFQDDCETRITILEEANIAAGKMTNHEYAENNIKEMRVRWESVHTAAVSWVGRITNLVECWNLLDGRVVELSSWVSKTDSENMDQAGLSIEKLETHLQMLKETFAEKEEMLKTLKDSCGPNANYDQTYPSLKTEETKTEETKSEETKTEESDVTEGVSEGATNVEQETKEEDN